MFSKEKENDLRQLGVHDLRNIARLWGVPCPTMKVKEELISLILKARAGKLKVKKKNKAGRPAKSLLTQNSVEQLFFPDSLSEIKNFRNGDIAKIERDFAFAQTFENKEMTFIENKKGYISKQNNIFYFIDTSKDQVVFVPNDFIFVNKLELGDFVLASCISQDNEGFIVKEIIKINDVDAKNAERKLCSIKEIKINDNPKIVEDIKEGEKVSYAKFNDISQKENILKKIKIFQENGFKIVIIAVALPADGLLRLKKDLPDCTYFISYFEDEPLYSLEAVVNAINNITIRARMGEKLLVFVVNLENIFNELKLYYVEKKNHLYNSADSLKVTRKLLGLNRCLANNGSITIITTTEES